jgi:hypothetical protein
VANGGNRYATVLMYLADTEEGGETVFPNIPAPGGVNEGFSECAKYHLAAKPVKGTGARLPLLQARSPPVQLLGVLPDSRAPFSANAITESPTPHPAPSFPRFSHPVPQHPAFRRAGAQVASHGLPGHPRRQVQHGQVAPCRPLRHRRQARGGHPAERAAAAQARPARRLRGHGQPVPRVGRLWRVGPC